MSQASENFPLNLDAIARGEISDKNIRMVLRFGLADELRRLAQGGVTEQLERKIDFINALACGHVTQATEEANQQHYEVPSAFFNLVLGKHLKYSCGYWQDNASDLDESERAMLALVCARAEIENDQHILDLGCGWGSLSLYLAEHFPQSTIVALSNSHSQKLFIESEIKRRNINNLQVQTADIATWNSTKQFDRVVSVEMFEHVHNFRALLKKIAGMMRPDALLFVHIFSHRQYAYPIINNWMADNFFTGGVMPSTDMLLYFQDHLTLTHQWAIDGTHYRRTGEAWLARLDAQKEQIIAIFAAQYGEAGAAKIMANWRLFFLAVIEIFGYSGGQEWMISHHLFRRR